MSVVVAALYKFVALDDYAQLRQPLLEFCLAQGIRGSLLLAQEGINGTIAGSRAGVDAVLDYLKSDPRLADLDHKESMDSAQPFLRMRVKLKKEIVTLGVEGVDPNRRAGTYVQAQDWNALIDDPQVLVLDTRNDYEVKIGSFKGALDPNTPSFRDFPAFVKANLDPTVHRKVAMFCTGGIRCEKASAYLLQEGFDEVYHLKGGILKYLEEVEPAQSLWQGECFVFDHRVAVDHQLEKGHYDLCHGCGWAVGEEEKGSPLFEEGVSCPHCEASLTQEQKERFRERRKQVRLAQARGEQHIGVPLRRHAEE